MKRKNILLVLIISLICSLAALAGCKGSDAPSGPSVSEVVKQPSITITNKNDYSYMVVGDYSVIYTATNNLTGFEVSYSSSDNSIATISKDGQIEAIKEGVATITATYSNGELTATDTANVSVSFSNIVPELKFGVPVDGGCSIQINDELKLNPYILFNGKKYTDLDIEATSSDGTKVAVDNEGNIRGIDYTDSLNPTTITITASWRGFNHSALTSSFEVSVSPKVSIVNANGYALTDIILSTLPEFDGIAYNNESDFDLTFYENNVAFEPTNCSYVFDNEQIVRRVGNKLVANKFGSTTLTVSFTTPSGANFITSVNVIVNRPKKVFTDTIELFSVFNGTFVDENLEDKTFADYIGGNITLIDAYLDGVQLQEPTNNLVKGIFLFDNSIKNANITVGTEDALYEFNCDLYQACINDASDLKVFLHEAGKVVNGTILLLKDIDASKFNLDHNVMSGESLASFSAIFDGQGYTISDLTLDKGEALIPQMTNTAVVKNVAFYNTHAHNSRVIAFFNQATGIVAMSDIYIHYAEDSYKPLGFKSHSSSAAKNIVIDYSGEIDYFNRNASGEIEGTSFYPGHYTALVPNGGDSAYSRMGILGSFGNPDSYAINYQSVVVFNPNHYVLFGSNGWGELPYNKVVAYYAQNEKYALDGRPLENHPWTEMTSKFIPGVRSYTSPAEMEADFLKSSDDPTKDNNSTASFNYRSFENNDNWIVINGTPYWKNTYSKVNVKLNGSSVSNDIELGNSSDVVKLSYSVANEDYVIATGDELKAGEYKLEVNSKNVVVSANEDNSYTVKMKEGGIATDENAVFKFTAKKQIAGADTTEDTSDDKFITLTKNLTIKLLSEQIILEGTFNGDSAVDLNAITFNSSYDVNTPVLDDELVLKAKSSFTGVYYTDATITATCENENLNIEYSEEDNAFVITLKNAIPNKQSAEIILASVDGKLTKSINVILEETIAQSIISTKGVAQLDTTTGEFFYNGKVVEGITGATIKDGSNSYNVTVADGKLQGLSSSVSTTGAGYTASAQQKVMTFKVNENTMTLLATKGADRKTDFANVSMTVVVDGIAYTFTNCVEVATRIINEASDLEVFNLTDEGDFNDGYYIMVNNVDASDFVSNHGETDLASGWGKGANGFFKVSAGFGGVFNGYGYTIKNLNLEPDNGEEPTEGDAKITWKVGGGLFGAVYGLFVIENVAFDNVNSNSAPIFAYALSACYDNGSAVYATSVFRNIYVKYSEETKYPFGFGYKEHDRNGYNTCYENIIVEHPYDYSQYTGTYSSIGNRYIGFGDDSSQFKLVSAIISARSNAQVIARAGDAYTYNSLTTKADPEFYYVNVITITNGYISWPNRAFSWAGINPHECFYAYNEARYADGRYLPYYIDPITKKLVFVEVEEDKKYYGVPTTITYKEDGVTIDYESTYVESNTGMIDSYVGYLPMLKYNSREDIGADVSRGLTFNGFNTSVWNVTANGPVWKTLF